MIEVNAMKNGFDLYKLPTPSKDGFNNDAIHFKNDLGCVYYNAFFDKIEKSLNMKKPCPEML